jgi:hypothetical protein
VRRTSQQQHFEGDCCIGSSKIKTNTTRRRRNAVTKNFKEKVSETKASEHHLHEE